MSHILCITNGLAGMAYASFELVRRLAADGHRVTYACPHDLGDRARAAGVEYRPLPPIALDPAPQLAPAGRGVFARAQHKAREWSSRHARRAAGVDALGMADFRGLLGESQPDLLLLDSELHEHVMTAVVDGVPTALLSPWFCTRERAGLPPIQSDIVPGRVARNAIEAAWRELRTARRQARRHTERRYFGTDRRGVLLEYARRIGFPRDRIIEDDGLPLFSYRDLTTLSMTAEAMELPHDRHPDLRYVGPMIARRRTAADGASAQRARSICGAARDAGRSIVSCAASTMPPLDQSFVIRLVEAFRERPDLELLIGLGGARHGAPSHEALRVPKNVHVFEWLPQLTVLEFASCAIHHAGIHTIHECIDRDVPMLVYPGRRFDQPGCAARLEYHGLANVRQAHEQDPAEFAESIDATIADDAMRARVALMREHFASEVRDRTLERLVRSLTDHASVSTLENSP